MAKNIIIPEINVEALVEAIKECPGRSAWKQDTVDRALNNKANPEVLYKIKLDVEARKARWEVEHAVSAVRVETNKFSMQDAQEVESPGRREERLTREEWKAKANAQLRSAMSLMQKDMAADYEQKQKEKEAAKLAFGEGEHKVVIEDWWMPSHTYGDRIYYDMEGKVFITLKSLDIDEETGEPCNKTYRIVKAFVSAEVQAARDEAVKKARDARDAGHDVEVPVFPQNILAWISGIAREQANVPEFKNAAVWEWLDAMKDDKVEFACYTIKRPYEDQKTHKKGEYLKFHFTNLRYVEMYFESVRDAEDREKAAAEAGIDLDDLENMRCSFKETVGGNEDRGWSNRPTEELALDELC